MKMAHQDATDLAGYFRRVWLYLASNHTSRNDACEVLAAHPGIIIDSWNCHVIAADCALRLGKRKVPLIADND